MIPGGPLGCFAGTLVRTQGSDPVRASDGTEYRTDPPSVDPVDTATVAASRSTDIEGTQQAMTALDDPLEIRRP
ncbi:MAG: hypothetical protein V5A55_08495 [Halovenus sp.]